MVKDKLDYINIPVQSSNIPFKMPYYILFRKSQKMTELLARISRLSLKDQSKHYALWIVLQKHKEWKQNKNRITRLTTENA